MQVKNFLRNTIKKGLSLTSPFFSIESLLAKSNTQLITPFYHCVSDNPTPHLKHLYPVKTVKQFEQGLDFLQKHFTAVSLSDLINKKTITKPSFFLSFDDGMQECYSVIAPILKQRKIPCSFFISTDFIDNNNLFYRHKQSLEKEGINPEEFLKTEPYLTSQQIKSLQADGFDIASHSKSHLEYNTLCVAEQIAETEASIKTLEDNFKIKHNAFSFPFTDFGVDEKYFNWSQKKLDMTFGCAGIKSTPYKNHMQRLPMENGCSAEKTIKTELLYRKFID